MFEECFGEGPFVFRLNDTGSGPHLLTQVCLERGWKEFNPVTGDHWNMWWKTAGFSPTQHRTLYNWQFINHVPKGSSICRKDNLARYLRCMRKVYGSIYDFIPPGFNLPLEYTKLAAECNKSRLLKEDDRAKTFNDKPVWICKPVGQSQGRGIFLFTKLSELTYDTNTIVQRYIERPLLIGGYKFDLRLYVCIPSYHPLTVYMYREGLARFGTDKFSLNDLRNPFRHLTNSSINKLGPGYGEMKERIGSGCKWTLRRLRTYFQQAGIADWLLWQRIAIMVILTVLSHANQVPQTINCFEFFGFDILIDRSLRPWLLEVNLGPALGNDCDADRLVKKPMLHDLFDLLGFPLYNTGLSVFHIWNDDSQSPSKDEEAEEEEEKLDVKLKEKSSVINAAAKWRKKHRKYSANSRTSSAAKKKSRGLSANRINLPKTQPNFSPVRPNVETIIHYNKKYEECKRNRSYRCWGNGKDWRYAPSYEGSWVRLWPMRFHELDENGKGSTKSMVAQVIKFSKLAKEMIKKHPSVPECELNENLRQEMEMTTEIWIPPK